MRAAVAQDFGDPDVIHVVDVEVEPAPVGHVMVEVCATAVNHVDVLVRTGAYPAGVTPPFVVGRDLVGVVAQDSGRWRRGTPVWSNSMGIWGRQGSCAEFVAVPVDRLYRSPQGVDPIEVVSVLHTAATAWTGLSRVACAQRGETLVVLGAGGGVGTSVVQIAKQLGLRVVAVDREENRSWCLDSGADLFVDRDDVGEIESAVRTDPPDICWDSTGTMEVATWLGRLRRGGRLVATAGLRHEVRLRLGELYVNDLSLLGFAVSNASVRDLRSAASVINRGLEAGWLFGRRYATLPLERTVEAHELMTKKRPPGRVVVRIQ